MMACESGTEVPLSFGDSKVEVGCRQKLRCCLFEAFITISFLATNSTALSTSVCIIWALFVFAASFSIIVFEHFYDSETCELWEKIIQYFKINTSKR